MLKEMDEIKNASDERSNLSAVSQLEMVVPQEGIYSSFSLGDIQIQNGQELTLSTKVSHGSFPPKGADGFHVMKCIEVCKIASRHASGIEDEKIWRRTFLFLDGSRNKEMPKTRKIGPTEDFRPDIIVSYNNKCLGSNLIPSSVSPSRLKIQECTVHVGDWWSEDPAPPGVCQIGETDQILDRTVFQQGVLIRNSEGDLKSVLEIVVSTETGKAAPLLPGSLGKISEIFAVSISNSPPDIMVALLKSKDTREGDGKTYSDECVSQNIEDFDRVCVYLGETLSTKTFYQPCRPSNTLIRRVEEDATVRRSNCWARGRVLRKAITSVNSITSASLGGQFALNFGVNRIIQPSPSLAASEHIYTSRLGQESRQPSRHPPIQNSQSSSHSQEKNFFLEMSSIVSAVTGTPEFLSLIKILANLTDTSIPSIEIPAHLRRQFDALATKFRDDEKFQRLTLAYFLEHADHLNKVPQLAQSLPKRALKKVTTEHLIKENQKLKEKLSTSEELQERLLKELDYFKRIARSIPSAMSTNPTGDIGYASCEASSWTCTLNSCKAVNKYFVFFNRQDGSTKKLERTNCEVCGTRQNASLESPGRTPMSGHLVDSSMMVSDDATLPPATSNSIQLARKRSFADVPGQCPPSKRSRPQIFPDQVQTYKNSPPRHERIGQPVNLDEIHLISLAVLPYHRKCRVSEFHAQCDHCRTYGLRGRPDAFDTSGQRFLTHYEYLQYMRLPNGSLGIPEILARVVFRNRKRKMPATTISSDVTGWKTLETMLPNATTMQQSSVDGFVSMLHDNDRNQPPQPVNQTQLGYKDSLEEQNPFGDHARVYSKPGESQHNLFEDQGNIIRLSPVAPPPTPKGLLSHQVSAIECSHFAPPRDQPSPSLPPDCVPLNQTNQSNQFASISAMSYGGLGNTHPGGLNSYPPTHFGHWNHQPHHRGPNYNTQGNFGSMRHALQVSGNGYHNSNISDPHMMRISNTDLGPRPSSQSGNQGPVAALWPCQYAGRPVAPWMPGIEGQGQNSIPITATDSHNLPISYENSQFNFQSDAQIIFNNPQNLVIGQKGHYQPVDSQASFQSNFQTLRWDPANSKVQSHFDGQHRKHEHHLAGNGGFLQMNISTAANKNEQEVDLGSDDDLFGEDGSSSPAISKQSSHSLREDPDRECSNLLGNYRGPVFPTDFPSLVVAMNESAVAMVNNQTMVSPTTASIPNRLPAANGDSTKQKSATETSVPRNLQRSKKIPCVSSKGALAKTQKPLAVKTKSSSSHPVGKSAERKTLSYSAMASIRASNATASMAIGGRRKSWETPRNGSNQSGNREIIEVSDDETDVAAEPIYVDKNTANEAAVVGDTFDDGPVHGGPDDFSGSAVEQTDISSIEFELEAALEAAFALQDVEASSSCQDVSQSSDAADHGCQESTVEHEEADESQESEEE